MLDINTYVKRLKLKLVDYCHCRFSKFRRINCNFDITNDDMKQRLHIN